MVDQEKLKTLGISSFERDIRRFSEAELREHFGAKSSGRIMLRPLFRAAIFQHYERVKSGVDSGGGNLRSIWYRVLKPILSHMRDDDAHKMDPYQVMIRVFSELVVEHGLFRYSDLKVDDEQWEERRIGVKKPNVVVFAEKRGWVRFLREINEEFDVTSLALGGFPSAVTSEYTALHVGRAMRRKLPVHLIGIVDYDPSGKWIAETFKKHLEAFGLEVASMLTMVDPKHFDPVDIEIFRFPLPGGQGSKNEGWISEGGGIAGEAFGLEAESMDRGLVRELVGREIEGLENGSSNLIRPIDP